MFMHCFIYKWYVYTKAFDKMPHMRFPLHTHTHTHAHIYIYIYIYIYMLNSHITWCFENWVPLYLKKKKIIQNSILWELSSTLHRSIFTKSSSMLHFFIVKSHITWCHCGKNSWNSISLKSSYMWNLIFRKLSSKRVVLCYIFH